MAPCNIHKQTNKKRAHGVSTILKELQATMTEESWQNSAPGECSILIMLMYAYDSETTEALVTTLYANLQYWTM